jgi:SAM-dependent methyltransferase
MGDHGAYEWRTFTECNMCGASIARARALGRRFGERQGWRPGRNTRGISTTVQRCAECGLVFANPMPLPVDIEHHYGIPAEDYWQDADLSPSAEYFAAQILEFRRLYRRPGPFSALDIGAGVGKAMASLEAAGFDTFGFEPSSSFRDRAISHTGIAADRLAASGIEDADYPDGRFDLVTFGAVLEHLPDPAAAIVSALAWTTPGGLLHVEVPSSEWLMARLVDRVYRLQRRDLTCHLSPLHIPFHLFEFTPRSFERHATRAGYEIACCRRYVGQTYAPRWAEAVLVPLMEATRSGLQLEVWLRKPGQG